MKREVVPTSPQYKGKDKKEKINKTKYSLKLAEILILLFISVIGGVCGSLLISNYSVSWPYGERLIVRDSNTKDVVYINDNEVTEVNAALEKIEPSTMNIFAKKANSNYLENESLGSAIIITSDGWLISVKKSFNFDELENYVVISHEGISYDVEDMVGDDYSGVMYIKISALNLTPVQFADLDNVDVGDSVVAAYNSLYSGQRAESSTIENTSFHDKIDFVTTGHAYDYLIEDDYRKEYLGSPLLNLKGEVIGMNILDNRVVPHKYFTDIMPQVITNKKAERTNFNINYRDLSKIIIDNNEEKQRGVEVESVIATENSIIVKDIIIKIDGQEIDKFHNFTDLIHEYKVGDAAELTVIRDEKEQEIEVTL